MSIYNETKVISVVTFGAFLNALALNLFLIPAKVLSSGFTGIAQLAATLLHNTPFHISTGILLLVLNIPVACLGWLKVGHRFTFYSILSVAMTTFFLALIPIHPLTQDILLNAVFGGAVQSIGVGLTLKFGGSTGGMDIIAMIMSRVKDRPIGAYLFSLNGLIVLSAGFFFSWRRALYTLLTLYVSSRVIDAIHTRHEKLTAMIVTNKGKAVQQAIYQKLVRGITRLPAKGGYTDQDKEVLMIVITRYELIFFKKNHSEHRPRSFYQYHRNRRCARIFPERR
ncbi:YitT family protein [Terrilactibacillus sp. S3-3]|nr:YitT family protein [Terrilactibacillus sp. S3-3]